MLMLMLMLMQVLDDAEEVKSLQARLEKLFKAKQVFHVYCSHLIETICILNLNVFRGSRCIRILPQKLQNIGGDDSCLKISFHCSSKVSDEAISSTLRRKREDMAVKVIQRAFRRGRDSRVEGKPAAEASDSSPPEEALE